jgi:hypothetical protein
VPLVVGEGIPGVVVDVMLGDGDVAVRGGAELQEILGV